GPGARGLRGPRRTVGPDGVAARAAFETILNDEDPPSGCTNLTAESDRLGIPNEPVPERRRLVLDQAFRQFDLRLGHVTIPQLVGRRPSVSRPFRYAHRQQWIESRHETTSQSLRPMSMNKRRNGYACA